MGRAERGGGGGAGRDPKRLPSAQREANILKLNKPHVVLSFVAWSARAQAIRFFRTCYSWLCPSSQPFHILQDLSHVLLFFSSPLCMAVPQWQPATWEVWAHCDLYSSCLLEGAVVQLHICIFIEPYSLLHSLLTAADGATIFHTVWERRRGTGLNITWRRQQLWSNQENRTDRELETE